MDKPNYWDLKHTNNYSRSSADCSNNQVLTFQHDDTFLILLSKNELAFHHTTSKTVHLFVNKTTECVCLCVFVYFYVFGCLCVCLYRMCVYMCRCVFNCMHVGWDVYLSVCVYVRACVRACVTLMLSVRVCVYVHMGRLGNAKVVHASSPSVL